MKTANQQVAIGSLLGGRYEVREALGQGGMATVFLAWDRQYRREVAIKLMRDELTDDPEFVKRFATEARAAASLDHPNIVRVLDYGQDNQVRYIVQEYVNGSTLKELIEENGFLPFQVAIPLMIQISLALEHAHRRGVIHRDMKPQNVLITPDMTAKVTDFGIARASNANTITLTSGVAFGSVHYFSPEQARGGQVTERSDLYSLGIMLYEMVTGRLPFDGDSSVAVAIKQLQEMPLRPSSQEGSIPYSLDDIIFKAIQKNPERRYRNASEFVRELDRFLIDPNGVYGIIQQGGGSWNSGTSAIGVSSVDSNFDKVDEIERSIKQRRRNRFRDSVLILVLVALTVFGLSVLVQNVVKRFTMEPMNNEADDTVVVGLYIGRKLEEVNEELQSIYGENLTLEAVNSPDKEAGIIFDQSPDYGTKMSRDKVKLTLRYSLGKEIISVPDLAGLSEEEAKRKLKEQGLVPLIRRERAEEVKKGEIVRSEPEAGTEINSGGTVTLFISSGKKSTRVPNFVGLTWQEAEKLAKEADLEIRGNTAHRDEYNNLVEVDKAARYILKQGTEVDTEVNSGSVILLEYGDSYDMELVNIGLYPGMVIESEEETENTAAISENVYVENNSSTIVMPDIIGLDILSARATLDGIWPAGANSYSINYLSTGNLNMNDSFGGEGPNGSPTNMGQNFQFPDTSRGFVVATNIRAGTTFNPNFENLIITVSEN